MVLVHGLGEQAPLPLGREGEGEGSLPLRLLGHVPGHAGHGAIRTLDRHGLPVAQQALALELLEEGERPEGGLGNTPIGHQAKAAVEGGEGHALLLEHVAKGPVGVGLVHLPQAGQQPGDVGGVAGGVVDRAVRRVRGVKLCDVHGQALVLRVAVDDFPGAAQLLQANFGVAQAAVAVAAHKLGVVEGVEVAGDKVQGQAVLVAVLHKVLHPLHVLYAADGRAAHGEAAVHLFHGGDGLGEQAEVLLFVGALPEAGQVGLVPHLQGPGQGVLAVALQQVAQQGLDQGAPLGVVLGRGGVALPVEHGLVARGHLPGHKAQLQEGAQAQLLVAVQHAIQVGEVVFRYRLPLGVFVLLVDGHVVAEQAVAPDVGKADVLLHQFQLVVILLVQGQAHAAGADAVIGLVVELLPAVRGEGVGSLCHSEILLVMVYQMRYFPLSASKAKKYRQLS